MAKYPHNFMAAHLQIDRFVPTFCNHTLPGPGVNEYLRPDELARLSAVCRAARRVLPRPSAEDVETWKSLCARSRGVLFVAPELRFCHDHFYRDFDRAWRSPFFLSNSAVGVLHGMISNSGLGSTDTVVSIMTEIMRGGEPKPSKKRIVYQALANVISRRRPIGLLQALDLFGPETLDPGSPGREVVDVVLASRANLQFTSAMEERGTLPRVWKLNPVEWFGFNAELRDKTMPEPIVKAILGAVRRNGRPCLINLSATPESQIGPSYTRPFVEELEKNPGPMFITGDAFLPTDPFFIAEDVHENKSLFHFFGGTPL